MLALRENLLTATYMYKLDQNMQPSDLGNKPRKILRKILNNLARP